MSAATEPDPGPTGPTFEVCIRGELSDALVAELGAVRRAPTTTLLVPVLDRSQLHGMMRRVDDHGLELLSIHEVTGALRGARVHDGGITRSR